MPSLGPDVFRYYLHVCFDPWGSAGAQDRRVDSTSSMQGLSGLEGLLVSAEVLGLRASGLRN